MNYQNYHLVKVPAESITLIEALLTRLHKDKNFDWFIPTTEEVENCLDWHKAKKHLRERLKTKHLKAVATK